MKVTRQQVESRKTQQSWSVGYLFRRVVIITTNRSRSENFARSKAKVGLLENWGKTILLEYEKRTKIDTRERTMTLVLLKIL